MKPVRIEFPEDCQNIQKWLLEDGWYVDLPTAQEFWCHHSEEVCAGWLCLSSKYRVVKAFEAWMSSPPEEERRRRPWVLLGRVEYEALGDSLREQGFKVTRHPTLQDVWCYR